MPYATMKHCYKYIILVGVFLLASLASALLNKLWTWNTYPHPSKTTRSHHLMTQGNPGSNEGFTRNPNFETHNSPLDQIRNPTEKNESFVKSSRRRTEIQVNTMTLKENPYLIHTSYNGTDLVLMNVTSDPKGWQHSQTYHDILKITLVNELFQRKPIPEEELKNYHKFIVKTQPFGSWPPYNFQPLKDFLQEAYNKSKEEGYVVPSIVHFNWFYGEKNVQMKFYMMMCLLAAHKKLKPHKILFWHDVMPAGKWWDYAVKNIPELIMVYREAPRKIFNNSFKMQVHKSDIVRLEAIITLGGIYVDLDALVLQSFDRFRESPATHGTYGNLLMNGLFLGSQDNIFHWIWYLSYSKYEGRLRSGASMMVGMDLARKYPQHVTVIWKYMLRPNHFERFYYFHEGWLWNWHAHYSVHLNAAFSTEQFSEVSLHKNNTVLGEMYRYILLDEHTKGVENRPSLYEMSSWHQKNCKKLFPRGTWDCDKINQTYTKLNDIYHFENSLSRQESQKPKVQ